VIDETQFADVYSLTTGRKQRVPRAWLDDPVLGRDFRKTPSQREFDGELPPRPAADATAKEIDAFAAAAEIDLSGIRKNDDKLVVIEEVFGPAPVQSGLVEIEPAPPIADPLAPERVAQVDPPATTQTSGDTESSDETPAAGDEEN
jgi:hypothetical protein